MIYPTYFGFLCGLGSLLVATLGTPVWVAPRFFGFGRQMVGWLMAAVAVRALADAPHLLLSDVGAAPFVSELQRLGVLASMVLFAEAARCSASVSGRRPLSVWWHLPAALGWGFHGAVLVLPDVAAGAGIFARISWLAPAALAGYSIAGIWRALKRTRVPPRRAALKLAASAFTLANFRALESPPGVRDLVTVVLVWLTVIGLSALVLTLPKFRRRVAFALVAALAAVPFLGPLLCELNVRWVEGRFEARARAVAASARPPPGLGLDLVDDPADPPEATRSAREALAAELRRLRRRDNSVRDAYYWVLRDGGVWRFLPGAGSVALALQRPALPVEVGHQRDPGADDFFVQALDDENGGFVAVDSRVRRATSVRPAIWLAVEYPAAIWTLQTETARRNAASLVALFAVIVAAGLILGSAQAVENAGQTRVYRAVAADRAKREFLAFLSHELRTPLQSVLGRAELLQRAPLTAGEQGQVAAILEDGRLLLRLVTDLLDLGAIEAGRLRLQPAPCDLPAMLRSLVESHRARAVEKQLSLRLEVAPGVPDTVLVDEARLRQMLGNLLGNALKYTERGEVQLVVRPVPAIPAAGEVRPAAGAAPERRDPVWQFVVRDTGPGVPPAQIDRLFSLFTRVDAGNVLRREGTGVGLALVRRLCTLMGGRVWVANRPEGGADFTLQIGLPGAPRETLRAAEAKPAAPAAAHGRRALVVEDNPNARSWLADALAMLGFSVGTAGDGERALALAAAGVDLVLLDINLPGRDGLSVARELRALRPGLRIVGCSAEAFTATREAALAAGMDAYLVKPVSLAALEAAVGEPAATDGDLFARLQSKTTTREARDRLRDDWPRMRGLTNAALTAGDHEALRRLAHYLKSTALLLGDDRLGDLCRRLAGVPTAEQPAEAHRLLAEVDRFIAERPAET